MAIEITVELISSGVAIATALFSALFAYYVTDRQKQRQDREIEKLKSELADGNAERDARRDYEYEARKKLYAEYEPAFFRFSEAAEAACSRICSLAKRAREGNLEEGGWLETSDYYRESVMYYLLAPLAHYRLLRSKLTFVDLRVDQSIYSAFILGKVLFVSLSDSFKVAEACGLPYSPFRAPKHRRQDVPIGITENLIELITEKETGQSDIRKVMNLTDFQKVVETSNNEDLEFFTKMICKFHPDRMEVLWSVLLAQVIIYKVMRNLRKQAVVSSKELLLAEVKRAADDLRLEEVDWRNIEQQKSVSEEKMKRMLVGASQYICVTIEKYY